MSKIAIVVAFLALFGGAYFVGVDAGVDKERASNQETEKKAKKEDRKKADEILELKEKLKRKTGETITIIRKIPDVSGCLNADLSTVGISELLRRTE